MLCNRVQKLSAGHCRIILSFYVIYFTRASHAYKHTQPERYRFRLERKGSMMGAALIRHPFEFERPRHSSGQEE